MGSKIFEMDAYQIFCRYLQDPTWNDFDDILKSTKDADIFGLVSKMAEERDQLTSKLAHTHIETPKKPSKQSTGFLNAQEARLLSNTSMAPKSARRISSLCKYLNVHVPMDWVRAFASRVTGSSTVDRYQTLRDSDSHVHIVSNNVIDFLKMMDLSQPGKNITTWSWSDGSVTAIHIQKLKNVLRLKFPETEPTVSFTFLCSIGLPYHEMFKPKDFIVSFKKYRFKYLTNETIIKTCLRKIIQIEKVNPKTESMQLIEEYDSKKHLLASLTPATSVEQYVFKHWYSWPEASTLPSILDQVKILVDTWRLT